MTKPFTVTAVWDPDAEVFTTKSDIPGRRADTLWSSDRDAARTRLRVNGAGLLRRDRPHPEPRPLDRDPFPPCGGRCHCEAMTDEGNRAERDGSVEFTRFVIYHRPAERRAIALHVEGSEPSRSARSPSSGPSGHLPPRGGKGFPSAEYGRRSPLPARRRGKVKAVGSTPREARRRLQPVDPRCDFRLSDAHRVEQYGIIAERRGEMRVGVTGVAHEGEKDFKLTPHQGFSLREAAGGLEQSREIVEIDRDIGMVLAVARFVDGERAAHQGLSLREAAGGLEQCCQIAEAYRDQGMVLAVARLVDGERAAHQGLSLREAAGGLQQMREIVEVDRDLGMVLTVAGFVDGERVAHQGLRLREPLGCI